MKYFAGSLHHLLYWWVVSTIGMVIVAETLHLLLLDCSGKVKVVVPVKFRLDQS
jgi:hypothetical protein